MALKYVQTLTLYQAGAGNIIGATSVVLTSLTDIYGNAITSMTPFGTTGYITLEPDTTNEEGATFTGITVNANGTTTLTGVSTILAQSPYTAISGLVRNHAGGSKVVVTDNVAFWNTFANINNDQTFAGANSFTQKVGVGAVTSSDLGKAATVDFVNAIAVAGAPNASPTVKGIVQEATQAQVLAKTAAGSTGAELYINPATLASTLLSDYKADTGAANAYVITPAPAITAYVAGQIFSFKAVNANTTTSTLAVNALSAQTIKNSKAGNLVANDILAGQIVTVEYDGTNFQLLSPSGNGSITDISSILSDGSDGAGNYTSGTTNLTRDMFFTTLNVSVGATLNSKNFKIFCSGIATINGTLMGDTGGTGGAGTAGTAGSGTGGGGGGTGGTAGAATATGSTTPQAGVAGGTGGQGSVTGAQASSGSSAPATALTGVGTAGVNAGTGGTGGNGSSSTGNTGGTGTGTVPTLPVHNNLHSLFSIFPLLEQAPGSNPVQILGAGNSGAGGGGGGAGGANSSAMGGGGGGGGGSGAAGGTVFLAAQTIAGAGTISTLGGPAGNGAIGGNGASGNAGGGGGGAGGSGGPGGLIVLVYHVKTFSGTITQTGGAAGTGAAGGTHTGSGTDGATGGSGSTGATGAQVFYQF